MLSYYFYAYLKINICENGLVISVQFVGKPGKNLLNFIKNKAEENVDCFFL